MIDPAFRIFRRISVPVITGLAFVLTAALAPVHAETWQAMPIKVPGGKIEQIRITGEGAEARTFVFARARWLEVTACADHRFCFTPRQSAARKKAPKGGLPDGFIAQRRAIPGKSGPVSAWYEQPTKAYGHGILGDTIEAAALTVETTDGKRSTIVAGRGHVFEDLTPRLSDLDGDGENEIIAIRSDTGRGAAIAVYGVVDGALVELAATPPIGLANRWRNPSLIVRNPASGETLIGEVVTPHIGGTLRFWALSGNTETGFKLLPRGSAKGFSNHAIGSRQLGLSANGGNGLIAVPASDRSALRIMQVGAKLVSRGKITLPGRIDHAIGVIREPSGPVFLVGLADGSLHAVSRLNPDFYCISNRDDELRLMITETQDGQRREILAASGRNWCVPRAGLKTVWAFTDQDAIEGCSHLVASKEAGLDLERYASFDNCRWAAK
jgi:hypothetical protein